MTYHARYATFDELVLFEYGNMSVKCIQYTILTSKTL